MTSELLEIVIPLDLRYRWSAGPHLGAFLRGLKEARILANRCPSCARLQLPPTPVCGRCHVAMGQDWVELSHQGTVISSGEYKVPRLPSPQDWVLVLERVEK